MSSKTCIRCGSEKPIALFYLHKMMRDGHLNVCIECVKARVREHRAKNIDLVRAYDRERAKLPNRRCLNSTTAKDWRVKHKNWRAAQIALGNAVKTGRVKPMPCFICGEKAHAHHPDYDAPLAVAWLCPSHHKQAHLLVSE